MSVLRFPVALLIAGPLCFGSCSTGKQLHRLERDSLAVTAVRQALREENLQVEQAQRYTWQDGRQTYQADILPTGPFRFSADSGFVGRASAVRIAAVRQDRRAEAEQKTTASAHGRTETLDSSAIAKASAKQVERSTVTEPVRLARYVWFAGCVSVVFFLARYLKGWLKTDGGSAKR